MVKSKISRSPTATRMKKRLPDEIIFEILSRLPVRSLLQFKSVAKSWHSMIANPHFSRFHLQMSLRTPKLNNRLLIISPSLAKSINLDSSPPIITKLNHPLPGNKMHICVLGSCNGLVCLLIGFGVSLIMYNPSTRESRSIDLLGSSSSNEACMYRYCGFGFDSGSHEYKVVRQVLDPPSFNEFRVEVFSLSNSTNHLTAIRELSCDYMLVSEDMPKLLNESVHWLGRCKNDIHRMNQVIVRLDLAREVFDEMPQPMVHGDRRCYGLCVVGGCLCVVSINLGDSVDLWVMKDYGVKSSWTKMMSMSGPQCMEYLTPLTFIGEKKVLLLIDYGDKRKLLVFDSEKGSFKKFINFTHPVWFEATMYVESLISP